MSAKMNLYWYISDAKIDSLRQSLPRTWSQDLILKLKFKSPWLEVEAGARDIKSAISNCEMIERTLDKDGELQEFELLNDKDCPTFIRFEIRATRVTSDEAYWIGGYSNNTAILLGGSPKHAIGDQSSSKCYISPSINPVGSAAQINSAGIQKTLEGNLSYTWQEVMRSGAGTTSEVTLPRVEGVAIFAGRFPTVKAQMRRVEKAHLTHLVVASPIFVRQI